MTHTTTTDLSTEAFDAAVEELEAVVAEAPKGRYARRDRLGRFVKAVRSDQLKVEGAFVNASDGTTHAHENCGNLKGLVWTVEAHAAGWLCAACVEVPESVFLASMDVAPSHGDQDCVECGNTLRMKSFPTLVVGGLRGLGGVRLRGTTCRKCEATGRKPRGLAA